MPASANLFAATAPVGPAPITRTSGSGVELMTPSHSEGAAPAGTKEIRTENSGGGRGEAATRLARARLARVLEVAPEMGWHPGATITAEAARESRFTPGGAPEWS